MSHTASSLPPVLRCARCEAPIAAPACGVYALLPPSPARTGYRELRAVHLACAAAYEGAHGGTIRWLPLERIWPRALTADVS